jgi:hypothetical protein
MYNELQRFVLGVVARWRHNRRRLPARDHPISEALMHRFARALVESFFERKRAWIIPVMLVLALLAVLVLLTPDPRLLPSSLRAH